MEGKEDKKKAKINKAKKGKKRKILNLPIPTQQKRCRPPGAIGTVPVGREVNFCTGGIRRQ